MKDSKAAQRAEYRSRFRAVKLPKSARTEERKRERARNEAGRARNAQPVKLLNIGT